MLGQVSNRALTELLLFGEREPIGEERADWRVAVLCSVLANLQRDSKQRSAPYKPEDFLADFDMERRWVEADRDAGARRILARMQDWQAAQAAKRGQG